MYLVEINSNNFNEIDYEHAWFFHYILHANVFKKAKKLTKKKNYAIIDGEKYEVFTQSI